MRIAQILYNKAHYIFEEDTQKVPVFPPDAEGNEIILVDITSTPEVQEGWDYDLETGVFTEPVYVEPEEIEPILTPEKIMAQQLSDMEIQNMEDNFQSQEERRNLGQQVSDLEIAMLEVGGL